MSSPVVHRASQGTLYRDQEGYLWEQMAPGEASSWERWSSNGPRRTTVWSRENLQLSQADFSSRVEHVYSPSMGFVNAYLTVFEVRALVIVHGLVCPLIECAANQNAKVKAGLLRCQLGQGDGSLSTWPWKLAHPYATFERIDAGDPYLSNGPFFVSTRNLASFPLPPGRYFLYVIFGGLIEDGILVARKAEDFQFSGSMATLSNLMRGDRIASSATNGITTDMRSFDNIDFAEMDFNGVVASATTGSLEMIDWGLDAEIYP